MEQLTEREKKLREFGKKLQSGQAKIETPWIPTDQPTLPKETSPYSPSSMANAYNNYKTSDLMSKTTGLLDNAQNRMTQAPQQFNPQTDQLYQQLLATARGNAVRDARTATNNAMVSLGSRGIGNSSAAVDRANQINQQAMSNVLLNLEPQYMQQAYDRFNQDRNFNRAQTHDLMSLAGMYNNLHQQGLDNSYRDRVFDRNVLESDRNFGYQQERDQVGDQRWQQQFGYQQQRDQVADNQWQQQFQYQQARDSIADARYQQEFDENVRQFGLNYALQKAQLDGQLANQAANLALNKQQFGLQQDQFAWQKEQAANQANVDMDAERRGLAAALRDGSITPALAMQQIEQDIALGFYTIGQADELKQIVRQLTPTAPTSVNPPELTLQQQDSMPSDAQLDDLYEQFGKPIGAARIDWKQWYRDTNGRLAGVDYNTWKSAGYGPKLRAGG